IDEIMKAPPSSGDAATFFRPGYPFVITDGGLLFNIRPDGTRSLCIPHNLIGEVLAEVHDEKHHFGKNRIL
ncbi:hypothetical protein B0T26DRAFT_601764, partial [Lasiosphaeria miniovina]